MVAPPVPENETERQKALIDYEILDTPCENDYDEIVKLASEICETPISLISLIDMQRQWFKANVGLDVSETGREIAFCSHAILGDDIMAVEDAGKDERFFDNPLVTDDPNIRFYAGMPLITLDGFKLGTLCVIDRVPRQLNDFQKNALRVLSHQIVNHLDRRLKVNQLNAALRTINEQHSKLEGLYQANTRMLSIVGHDLRAPLGTLKSMLEMYADEYISEADVKEMAVKLSEAYKYTEELIDNLLFWAQKQFDGKEPEFKVIDLHQKVEECIALLSFQVEHKGNLLKNNIPDGYMLETEPNILNFILRNLLNNANKFTTHELISVNVEIKNNNTVIEIKDGGIGIPEEKLGKLFDWDSKMSTYGTSGEKGSGIGLSMSQEFAEKLGGYLEVKSKVGEGTSFFIHLNNDKVD